MKDVTTTDLSDFGSREREMLIELLVAWREQGLPHDFDICDVVAMMNRSSGNVFLTNSEFQTCMMNGDKLERWYNCSNCGHEGFADECIINNCGCNECRPTDEDKGI